MKDASESRSAKICALCGGSFPWSDDGPGPGVCRDCVSRPDVEQELIAKSGDEWAALARDPGRSGMTTRHETATAFLDDLQARGAMFLGIDVDAAATILEGLELLAAIDDANQITRRHVIAQLVRIRGMFEAAGPASGMVLEGSKRIAERRAQILVRAAYFQQAAQLAAAEIERLRDRLVRTEKALASAESYQETLAGSIDDTFRIFTADVAEGPYRP